jgi:hypothetical protein
MHKIQRKDCKQYQKVRYNQESLVDIMEKARTNYKKLDIKKTNGESHIKIPNQAPRPMPVLGRVLG